MSVTGAGLARSGGLAALLALTAMPVHAANDPNRFCDPKAPNLVLMLDVTTPYDVIDKTALIDGVGTIFESLTGGERIVIRTIEDAFSNSRRLLDACMPYCPPAGMFGDLFSDCTQGVVINEKKLLRRTLVEKLSALLDSARELDHSEIIRTLTMALKEEGRAERDNRIFIYSDMIENSAYLAGKDFFAAKDGAIIEKLEHDGLLPDVWQADVRVFGIGRTGVPGNRTVLAQAKLQKLTTFWTKYFAAGGGTLHMSQNLSLD